MTRDVKGAKSQDRTAQVILHCRTAMVTHAKRGEDYTRRAQQWKIGVEAAMADMEAERERALAHAHAEVLAILGALEERCPCGRCGLLFFPAPAKVQVQTG